MKQLGLPFDLSMLKEAEDISIDMSSLNFPCSENKQIRSSFLFIRNSGNKVKLCFDNCNYEMKEKFLISYFTENISIEIPDILTTWIEILIKPFSEEMIYDSILNKDEIIKFRENNFELINNIYNIIISLPICAIETYSEYMKEKNSEQCIEMDFQSTDYDELNMYNLINLLNFNELLYIIGMAQNIDGLKPMMYEKYFRNNELNYRITHKLPYLMLMNLFMGSDHSKNKFLEDLEEIVRKQEEKDND